MLEMFDSTNTQELLRVSRVEWFDQVQKCQLIYNVCMCVCVCVCVCNKYTHTHIYIFTYRFDEVDMYI
jgi:hypothetical protein